jgi:predicted nuclease with TOPRIM domain
MNSLSVKLRSDKLSIEKSIFSMRNFIRGVVGANAKQIRERLDQIQAERNSIMDKINETERHMQLASENGNLSQVAVNLYQKNLEELNRLKGALKKNYEDIYGKVKLEYEKAILFGHRGDQKTDSITIGKTQNWF